MNTNEAIANKNDIVAEAVKFAGEESKYTTSFLLGYLRSTIKIDNNVSDEVKCVIAAVYESYYNKEYAEEVLKDWME